MLSIRVAKGPTGRLLTQLLEERGLLRGEVRGVVNYGYGAPTTLPCLNKRAGTFNKLQELQTLNEKRVRTVPLATTRRGEGLWLGRTVHHTRGRDINIGPINAIRGDFFTQLIPKAREFRVWAYRRKAFATYEKVLTYKERYGRRGRSKEVWNWKNGFAFQFVRPEDSPEALKALAASAVDALGLDFGAVDIILGKDGQYYVLEVNTAPGTQGEPRQAVVTLVNKIQRWAEGGFKRRNGDAESR